MGKVKVGDACIAYIMEEGSFRHSDGVSNSANNTRYHEVKGKIAEAGLPMTEGRDINFRDLENRADLAAAFLMDIADMPPAHVQGARNALQEAHIELSYFVGEDGNPLITEPDYNKPGNDYNDYICKTASAVARRLVGEEFRNSTDMGGTVEGAVFYQKDENTYIPVELEQQEPGPEPTKPGIFKQFIHNISDRFFADDFEKYDKEKSAFDIRQKAWNAGTDYQNRLGDGKQTLARATGVDPSTLRKREPVVIEGINKRSEVSKTVTPKTSEHSKEHTFSK